MADTTSTRRRSGKKKVESKQTCEPIDRQKQEAIVKSLQDQADKQASDARNKFAIVFAMVSCLLTFVLVKSVLRPYDWAHEAFFQDAQGNVPPLAFQASYAVTIGCFASSAYIVKFGDQDVDRRMKTRLRLVFFAALIFGMLNVFSWTPAFLSSRETVPYLFYWLPLGGIIGLSLAAYVDRDAKILVYDAVVMGLLQYEYQEI